MLSVKSSSLLPKAEATNEFFYTFPPTSDALSGSLRLAWIYPWAIFPLWCSYLSLFLPLCLQFLSLLSLPLSISLSHFPPATPSISEEIVKPIFFGDTFTGCPGWTMTQDLLLPPTATWYKAANKLAANYLSNTCCWGCWKSLTTTEQLVKETTWGLSIWPETTT